MQQCFSCERIFSESVVSLMLSCGHTTCNLCVAKIQEEKFPCPHCVRPYQSSVQNLTKCSALTNPTFQNIESFCEICEDEESHPASFKCIDCNQFLCDSMAQSHKKFKISRLHNLVPISELPTANDDSVLPRPLPKCCPTHNHPYTHYNESIQGSHLLCLYCAAEIAEKSLPLSTPSLSEQKVQQARAFSPQISDRIASLTSTYQDLSGKIQQLDKFKEKAPGQIKQTFQTYRRALDAREEDLVKEQHKSARFEMVDEAERAQLYVGQLEQDAKGLEEMEAAFTLTKTTFPTSPSSSLPEGLLVDVCLLEASLQSSFSHSMEVEVSPTALFQSPPPVPFPPSPPLAPTLNDKEKEDKKEGDCEIDEENDEEECEDEDEEEEERTLISASEKGELEVVRALLDRGDNVNQKDESGSTPLYYASREDHLSIVSLLLDRGANINEKSIFEFTPLHCASKKGHLSIISLLLDRGANIHEKDIFGDTPLHCASHFGHLPIVSLLLVRGANIHEKAKNGYTPLHYACRDGHLSIVSLLLDRGANTNEKYQVGLTPLHCASSNGHLSIVSLLLDKGVKINEKGNVGLTLLHDACKDGHLSIVSLLLDRGANIHEKGSDGWTPLHSASIRRHLPIVSLLLDRGANIHEKDNRGYTPLHWASHYGHLPIVSLLLARGANIHEKIKDGSTPLHEASRNGHLSIVSPLLDRGANINEKDIRGWTPLRLAETYFKRDVSALLRQRGGTR